jgi:hypothetical protein
MGVDVLSRGVAGIAALAATLLAVAACAAGPGTGSGSESGGAFGSDEHLHSADDTHAQFYALLDETEQLVGGVWHNMDDSETRGCVIPLASSGTAHAALRLSTSPQDDPGSMPVADAVDAVDDSWTAYGLDVERSEIAGVSEVLARGDGGEVLIFRASDKAMTLQGESACSPE